MLIYFFIAGLFVFDLSRSLTVTHISECKIILENMCTASYKVSFQLLYLLANV